jgi:release factor glutamine methyltransferase
MGKERFFGLDFFVDEGVFIPRPETEVLVQAALDTIKTMSHDTNDGISILDLGTGSGCIAISLMVRLNSPLGLSAAEGLTKISPNCRMFASDISDEALDMAAENARVNGVSEQISFIKSDVFAGISNKFDIIVSNPPYISRGEFALLQKEVLMEPRLALDGGEDGLDFYRRIFSEAPRYLKSGGYCLVEIGYGQRDAVKEIIENTRRFEFIDVKEDQYSIDRVLAARFNDQ